jgi:hypothetical protein
VLFVLCACLAIASLAAHQSPQSPTTGVTYFCPMHSDVTSPAPGTCRRCGMTLVAGEAFVGADYDLTLDTTPRVVRAGQPARLTLRVFHPETGSPVKDFTVVHDEPYHLFVVSEDMTTFFHVHPVEQADGSFVIDLTLPQPGPYRVFSDFLPTGGMPQIIARPLLTEGFAGDLLASSARLTPDPSLVKQSDGMNIALTFTPAEPIAGRESTMTFDLSDAGNGQPVSDLEPYLAAWGHTLALSDDLVEYIHSHPIEAVPATGRESLKGGPVVTFKAFFPRPGLYRSWTQFKRHGRITTVPFTFRVFRLGETSAARSVN